MKSFKIFIREQQEFMHHFWDVYSEEQHKICSEILNAIIDGTEPFEQKWVVVSKFKLESVYKEYERNGYQFFRPFKPLDEVIDRCMINLARLQVNTALAGHTQQSVMSVFDEYEDMIEEHDITEEQIDNFTETYLYSSVDNQYRISDYGIDQQIKFLEECHLTHDYTKKLIALDKFLNVIHARSDLASWYIEGGKNTLTKISGYLHDEEESE